MKCCWSPITGRPHLEHPLVNMKKRWKITMFNRKTMGKPWENGDLYEKSPCFMGKLTISMAMFNSFLYVHQRVSNHEQPTLFRQVMPQRPLRISRSSPGQNRVLPAVDTQYLQKGPWGFGWGFVNGYNYGDIMISIICWDTKPLTSFNYGCMNISTYLHSWNYTPRTSPNMEYPKKNMSLHVLH